MAQLRAWWAHSTLRAVLTADYDAAHRARHAHGRDCGDPTCPYRAT